MDWDTYKRLCDQPEFWSRGMLLRSAALLEARGAQALAARLRETLLRPCLPKPPGHRGPAATDMFALNLVAEDAWAVCEHVAAAYAQPPSSEAASAEPQSGTTRPKRVHGELVAWQEYARSCAVQPDAC